MSDENKQWTKKDQETLVGIIGSLSNNAHFFKGLGERGEIKESFNVQNSKEFGLGIFFGGIYFAFADYWLREHGKEISQEDIELMIFQITQVKDMIIDALFK